MDYIAILIAHYFLRFFHLIGMDSFVSLFGKYAYDCASETIRQKFNCHDVIWLGYLLPITLIVILIWQKKYPKK